MTPQPPEDEQDTPIDEIQEDELEASRQASLYFGSVAEFVNEFLVRVFSNPVPDSGLAWCPRWWAHAEAILRLEALWRSWEYLRMDPALGMSNWLTHHLDPQMRALMDPVSGPFARCTNGHRALEGLPTEAPPAGLFEDARDPWRVSGDPLSLD